MGIKCSYTQRILSSESCQLFSAPWEQFPRRCHSLILYRAENLLSWNSESRLFTWPTSLRTEGSTTQQVTQLFYKQDHIKETQLVKLFSPLNSRAKTETLYLEGKLDSMSRESLIIQIWPCRSDKVFPTLKTYQELQFFLYFFQYTSES